MVVGRNKGMPYSRVRLVLLQVTVLLGWVAWPASAVCLELWDASLCHAGNLTLLPQTEGDLSPACLDGTPYGVYFRPSPTGSRAWTVFLQGGGWCYDEHDVSKREKRIDTESTRCCTHPQFKICLDLPNGLPTAARQHRCAFGSLVRALSLRSP